MEVDWVGRGDQLVTVRRSCATQPASDTCRSGEIGSVYQYKDCTASCSNNLLTPCNNDLHSAADLFHFTIAMDSISFYQRNSISKTFTISIARVRIPLVLSK
jgi:hypothetical protein